MARSFLSTASKKVTDVRAFLRESADGTSIKYVAEKGAKHLIYIPYVNVAEADENGNEVVKRQLIAIAGGVHEWQTPDGKYKSTVCMKDVVRQSDDGSVLLNDGSCPFCERVADAWDIYRYRKELEEANCKLTGEDRKRHMETMCAMFADERKAKDAKPYMYILVVKYRMNGANPVIGADGLPEYDLKVMKLSASRVEKLQQQMANAGTELAGAEIIIEYPNTDDRRLQVSQSTTAPVFPNNMLTVKFPALLEKINKDVAKFEWDGIEKAFQEWAGMSTAEARKITDELFEKWDAYKKELAVNPAARYMEYVAGSSVSNPALEIGPAQKAALPGDAPIVPPAPSIPDANAVFGVGGGLEI